MVNAVVSGGTDGIGRALARHFLSTGNSVIIVGRSPQKGAEFLQEAERAGASDRARFIRADLGLVSEQRRVAAEIAEIFPVVDRLVLTAQHFQGKRTVTAEGFEQTFALYYLSRYVLSHALVPQLEKSANPVVLNVCGPGVPTGEIHWDDLQLEHGYKGLKAMMQGSRANDLLGVGFTRAHPGSRVRYVLYNPVFVATNFSGDYKAPVRLGISVAKLLGATVEKGIRPAVALVEEPPAAPLSAFKKRKPVSLDHKAFDQNAADRLRTVTEELLAART
ncbi:SDR family NAD(P)-dependent oxidoreductase [Streptomyces sp. NPDC053750]|uniref:SDR family NAD(P)-dependent oxidoreductase n=1 Tax=Streptomyces sp. NPDC053750 TaxID=3365714 RepID=UPI0037D2DD5B